MKLKLLITSVVITIGALFLTSSCDKKTDCDATITVLDPTGLPVQNANVKLYANVKTGAGSTVEADLKAEGVTDGSGVVKFTFKLPAILDITATSGSLVGQGLIKLEEGKNSDKTVNLQ